MQPQTVAEWRKVLKLSYKSKGISIIGIKTDESVLEIPEKIGEKEVFEVDSYAFRGCKSLTSITLPATVQRIGCGAFFACKSLSSVVLKNENVVIEPDAFRNCTALVDENGYVIVNNIFYNYCGDNSHVDIPEGVTNLGQCAFTFAPNVKSITIPTTIKRLPDYVLTLGEKLEDVYIPEEVKDFGKGVFKNCNNIKIHAPLGSAAEAYAKENDIIYLPC